MQPLHELNLSSLLFASTPVCSGQECSTNFHRGPHEHGGPQRPVIKLISAFHV